MVVQQKIDQLKGASHEEKRAVASGVAVSVVIVLIIAWGFLFMRKIRNTPVPSLENGTVPIDQFDMRLIQNGGQDTSASPDDDIRALRDSAAQSQSASYAPPSTSVDTSGQFGGSNQGF